MNVRFRADSGHRGSKTSCALMTQSGHPSIPRLAQEAEDCSDRCLIEIISEENQKEPLGGSGPFNLLIIVRDSSR